MMRNVGKGNDHKRKRMMEKVMVKNGHETVRIVKK